MTAAGPLICIVTGEPSGDLLGARLMAALSRATGGRARFMGVGGESMRDAGLDSLADLSEFAVMGFVEVLPKAARILRRVREITNTIAAARPDVLITVDSWGFTGRLNRAVRARGLGIPQIHYVAPMVWAWKEKRAEGVAATVDHLLCLLPNEPPYFERHGLSCTHVGHPVVEGGAGRGDAAGFRAAHGIPVEAPLLAVLPGSRRTETGRLLPVFADALGRLRDRFPDLHVVTPTVATVAADVEKAARAWPVPAVVVRGEAARYDAFAAADAAMAASGTVGLELALAGVPHLVAYRVSAVSAWLARRLLKVRYVNLVNLTLDRAVVPELLQEACTGPALAAMVERLLSDETLRAAQRAAFAEATAQLAGGPGSPSDRAARVVLDALGWKESSP
ncbi:lipid-A-disaccharide synthase [Novispirillum sp. DQ9]|uniref:lipid-A-disaccharide synthase n=1 Tax=Novispirillum sp. DQ9 TaxID=3398612 RepID=UPI003C7A51A0